MKMLGCSRAVQTELGDPWERRRTLSLGDFLPDELRAGTWALSLFELPPVNVSFNLNKTKGESCPFGFTAGRREFVVRSHATGTPLPQPHHPSHGHVGLAGLEDFELEEEEEDADVGGDWEILDTPDLAELEFDKAL